jgi:hypothetical protein
MQTGQNVSQLIPSDKKTTSDSETQFSHENEIKKFLKECEQVKNKSLKNIREGIKSVNRAISKINKNESLTKTLTLEKTNLKNQEETLIELKTAGKIIKQWEGFRYLSKAVQNEVENALNSISKPEAKFQSSVDERAFNYGHEDLKKLLDLSLRCDNFLSAFDPKNTDTISDEDLWKEYKEIAKELDDLPPFEGANSQDQIEFNKLLETVHSKIAPLRSRFESLPTLLRLSNRVNFVALDITQHKDLNELAKIGSPLKTAIDKLGLANDREIKEHLRTLKSEKSAHEKTAAARDIIKLLKQFEKSSKKNDKEILDLLKRAEKSVEKVAGGLQEKDAIQKLSKRVHLLQVRKEALQVLKKVSKVALKVAMVVFGIIFIIGAIIATSGFFSLVSPLVMNVWMGIAIGGLVGFSSTAAVYYKNKQHPSIQEDREKNMQSETRVSDEDLRKTAKELKDDLHTFARGEKKADDTGSRDFDKLCAKLRNNPQVLSALLDLEETGQQTAKINVADHLGLSLSDVGQMVEDFKKLMENKGNRNSTFGSFSRVPDSQSLLTQSPNLQAKERLGRLLQNPSISLDASASQEIEEWREQITKSGPEKRLDVRDFFPEESSSKSGKTEASNVVQYKQKIFKELYPEFDALEKDIKEIMAYTKLINTIQASETKQEELSSEIISELKKLQKELKDLRSQYAKKKEDFCKLHNMKRSDLSYVLRKTIKDKPVLIDSGYVVKFPFAYAFLKSKEQHLTY